MPFKATRRTINVALIGSLNYIAPGLCFYTIQGFKTCILLFLTNDLSFKIPDAQNIAIINNRVISSIIKHSDRCPCAHKSLKQPTLTFYSEDIQFNSQQSMAQYNSHRRFSSIWFWPPIHCIKIRSRTIHCKGFMYCKCFSMLRNHCIIP